MSWIVSPIISGVLSFFLMLQVGSLSMNTKAFSFRARLFSQQFLTSVCFMALAYLMDKLLNHDTGYDNEETIDDSSSGHQTFGLSESAYLGVLLAIGFLFGALFYRFMVLAILLTCADKIVPRNIKLQAIIHTLLLPLGTHTFEVLALNLKVKPESGEENRFFDFESASSKVKQFEKFIAQKN